MYKLKVLSDDNLIAEFANGNNSAFDILLERHQKRVYNYILHLVKDADVADDVFQETYVKIIMTIKQGRYFADGKFASWQLRIAHNVVIDYFRQEKSDATVSTDETDYDLLNRRDLSENTIEDVLIDSAICNDVHRLINALPALQREVLELRYFEDLSFKEIAERTGVSINTALGRMRYAIINLRRIAEENSIALTR